MKITPDIIRGEFIGTEAKITQSKHDDYVEMSGKIVDETRNTFTLLDGRKRKTILKESATFRFTFLDGSVVEILGRLLIGKPEDRLKKNVRRLW
jgi:ribonuclease P protein subunit POP4